MKTIKLLLLTIFLSATSAFAQEKPAAQGYFKDKPSNENQDRALKEIERQEKESSQPKESPTPEPKDRETKERPEPADKGTRGNKQ